MRNLKKFLALMLAMIMAMSLMVTANATSTAEDFADTAGITPEFVEAVDVLSGMRVFSGDGDNFKPAANITRAEMAAVIYRLVSGDVDNSKAGLYANYGNFKDVTADKWYAGYVGYCANNGLIKGRSDGSFDPTGNVTGYEALAMLLRAVGYDKNNEFSGSTWQVNVSTTAQQEGILRDVNTTQYGGTLHLAARRDVIASLVFRTAAYVPTVTYTPAMGYNKYIGVPVTGGNDLVYNRTLGYKAFGLLSDRGIVVGNQDTGETVTRMSFSIETAEPVYAYGTVAMNGMQYNVTGNAYDKDVPATWQANAIATFDAKTGLDLFAHEVDIWFDGRNTELNPAKFGTGTALNWRDNKQSNELHTYAYFDRSTLTEVVKLKDITGTVGNARALTVDNTAAAGSLGAVAVGAGFKLTAAGAVQNEAFERFLPLSAAGTNRVGTVTKQAPDTGSANGDTDFENLYLLISNSADKALDVVISLNIQVSEITGVDDVNAVKTVTMPQVNTAPAFISTSNQLSTMSNAATIEQGQLVPGSTTTLGQYEIGVHIEGTAPADRLPAGASIGTSTSPTNNTDGKAMGYDPSYPRLDEDAWFKLVPVTNTKEGVVVSYNAANGKVNLEDGTVLEQSILYNSVVPNTLPQVSGDDFYQHAKYRFFLTPDNKYLGAELVYGDTFIYGTYVDYDQKLSSSKFEYYLTGVTLNGETTTIPVSSLNGAPITGTNELNVPYRDTVGGSGVMNGLGTGVYRGFTVSGQALNFNFQQLGQLGVIAGDNGAGTTWAKNLNTDRPDPSYGPAANNSTAPEVRFDGTDGTGNADDSIHIGSTEVALGATYAGQVDIDGSATTTAGNNWDKLYFTEKTKFILVSGYGTDSLKAEVFNGISELRGSNSDVYIDLQYTVDNSVARVTGGQTVGTVRLSNVYDGITLSDMTYLTQSPFVYAQNRVLSRQADVVILPAAAVWRSTASDTRYVGNKAATLVDAGNDATQFTMYNNGIAESIWVDGLIGDTTKSAYIVDHSGHDHFYKITPTGRTATDGNPIYTVAKTGQAWTQNLYTASTMNAQTGSFEATMGTSTDHAIGVAQLRRVDSANITNLNAQNPAPRWPGINSLTTLNYAGSLGDYTGGAHHAGDQDLYVSAIVDGLNVTQIYVCYDQTPAGDH